jgi:hypothetical protein
MSAALVDPRRLGNDEGVCEDLRGSFLFPTFPPELG